MIFMKESKEPPIHADGRRFRQRAVISTIPLSRQIEYSLNYSERTRVFSGNIGVHRRPSAVADGFGGTTKPRAIAKRLACAKRIPKTKLRRPCFMLA
jgi:hypothetical protein